MKLSPSIIHSCIRYIRSLRRAVRSSHAGLYFLIFGAIMSPLTATAHAANPGDNQISMNEPWRPRSGIIQRQDVEFDAGGVTLRGWLYRPNKDSTAGNHYPAIVMTGGYGTTKEMFTDLFAEKFAAAGFVVLLFDNRGFGASDGAPRHEANPWQQVEDFRHAITYASGLNFVDGKRIGIWGSSYSGGHAIVVAATDRRVKCVAVQVPTINGTKAALRRVYGEAENALLERFSRDRSQRAAGTAPIMLPIMGDANSGAVYRSQDAIDWYAAAYRRAPTEKPEISLRSVEFARAYNPGDYIEHISPTPFLMQVAEKDYVTPTDLSLEAYRNALEPKSLRILPGAGHFDVYVRDFESTSSAALDWFVTYLRPAEL